MSGTPSKDLCTIACRAFDLASECGLVLAGFAGCVLMALFLRAA